MERHNTRPNYKPIKNREIIPSIDTQDGLIYGPDAWKIWNVVVLDKVANIPEISWEKNDPYFNEAFRKNYVLLYIPGKIRANDKEQDLTIKTFKEISTGPFMYFNKSVEDQFGNNTASGWVLISKKTIPDSRCIIYNAQEKMIEAQEDYHMPCVLEAMVLNLIVYAFTGEQLYGAGTYARCVEKLHDTYPVSVGDFGPYGLDVSPDFDITYPEYDDEDEDTPYRAAWVCRKFIS